MKTRFDEDTDGSRCFAHGVAHLLSDFGYEEGLALAGTVLLEMFERSEDHEQWSAPDSTEQWSAPDDIGSSNRSIEGNGGRRPSTAVVDRNVNGR